MKSLPNHHCSQLKGLEICTIPKKATLPAFNCRDNFICATLSVSHCPNKTALRLFQIEIGKS